MNDDPNEAQPDQSDAQEATTPSSPAAPLRGLRQQLASRQPEKSKKASVHPNQAQSSTDTPQASFSTPPPSFRERFTPEMEQEYQEALGDAAFESLIEKSVAADTAAELEPETRVKGKVERVHNEDVFVNLGGRHQGVVPLKQFESPPEPGHEVELVVVRFQAEEGLYDLSMPMAAVDVGNWSEVQEGQLIDVNITGSNKGGLECQVAGIRGFMPMGQVSIYRVENPEEMVGQKLTCVVIEANRDSRNLVLSHRAVMERERKENREKLLAELQPGQMREGIVRNLRDFGAFVDLGGIDGLVHISKLSWERVNHPSEVLAEGQKIKVRVENVDRESGKIGLSYRETEANPWDSVEQTYPMGTIVRGKVTKLMDFGAFVKLGPGVEGLIHISELAHGRIHRVSEVLSEGQDVEVKVLSVDREKQRIGLSLRALQAKQDYEEMDAEDSATSEPARPKKSTANLKGGLGKASGGEQFGLKL
jgi:small subunit ribosomal protein S1